MPSFVSVSRTGSGDRSTRRMISSFSEAGYLMPRPPQPRSCFFEQPVLQGEVRYDLLQRAGLSAQGPDLIGGRLPSGVPRQALLAGFQKLLGPAVVQVLADALTPAQLGDAVLAAQALQHDADLLFGRELPARGSADIAHDLFGRLFGRPGCLPHRRSSRDYDEPATLHSSTASVCLTSADGRQSPPAFIVGTRGNPVSSVGVCPLAPLSLVQRIC